MFKRVAGLFVLVFTLVIVLPILIGFLTSSHEAFRFWLGMLGGLSLMVYGVIGVPRMRRWLDVNLQSKAPYELRRQAIVDRGMRLYAVLSGLFFLIGIGLREYVPLSVRTPVAIGLILAAVSCAIGFGIASVVLVPAPPRRVIPRRVQPMPVVDDDRLDPEAQEILDDLRRLLREVVEDE